MAERFLKFDMVTRCPDLLYKWWNNLDEVARTQVKTSLGHLTTLMDMHVYPGFIQVITRFWDSERMVFRFGEVEMTPTIEEIQDVLETQEMCDKRKDHPDDNILIPDKPTSKKMKDLLLLVDADWLDTPNIPFIKFYERWGHENYFEDFPNEFHNFSTWNNTRPLAFSICLLGIMVFPRGQQNEIDSRIVSTAHAIFYGVGGENQKKYFNLVPIILADIYRSLGRCKNGHQFFQGCNILLQWWMSKHLATPSRNCKKGLAKWDGVDMLSCHEFTLYLRQFPMKRTKEAWSQLLYDVKEDNVVWMFERFISEKIKTQGRRFPFLVLVGIRGMRPYSPNRVMRQFGRKQIIPKQGDFDQYIVDYDGCEKVPMADEILREWSGVGYLKESIAKDRYNAGYDEAYKGWLKMDILRTITPGPHLDRQVEDVDAKERVQNLLFQQQWDERERGFQRREQEFRQMEQEFEQMKLAFQQREYESQRTLAFVTEKLAAKERRIAQANSNLDNQLNSIQPLTMLERGQLMEPYLTINKYLLREEADGPSGGAGPSTF